MIGDWTVSIRSICLVSQVLGWLTIVACEDLFATPACWRQIGCDPDSLLDCNRIRDTRTPYTVDVTVGCRSLATSRRISALMRKGVWDRARRYRDRGLYARQPSWGHASATGEETKNGRPEGRPGLGRKLRLAATKKPPGASFSERLRREGRDRGRRAPPLR
jgi:hypothetical protein